jgi:hypothetical protein
MIKPKVGEYVMVERSFPKNQTDIGQVVSLLASQFVYETETDNGLSARFCTYRAGDNKWSLVK